MVGGRDRHTPVAITAAGQAAPLREPLRLPRAAALRPPRTVLPASSTSFVGRTRELAELADLLTDPGCRLLTLVGPGGIGKTRLSLEVAAAAQESFEDGAAFVSLQPVADAEALAPAIATALGYALTGREDAREQVKRHLRPARLLLILDNFEHLLDEALWLAELLDEAPGLCLLVTSREALNLREEWRYPLGGLALPGDEGGDPEVPEQTEAVRLFMARAQQVRRDFSLAAERAGVLRLCRITEGMPLALELAAAWITALSPDAIAEEIERNLAFLATNLRNVAPRHRSVQAAFDHSWALLSEEERRAFRRLALFRGGFRREAAEQIAGANLPLLAALVDKSLLRYETDGRFHLHELLRHYAHEWLRAAPDEEMQTDAAHRDYYLSLAADLREPITGGAQREAVAAITAELDNIRAAWRSAATAGDCAALGRAAHTLTIYHDFRARYREGLSLLEEGLLVLRAALPSPQADRLLASMLVDVARFNHRLMRLPAMRAALAESDACYARLASPPPPGQFTDPGVWWGILALLGGHYAEAARLGEEAVCRNTQHDRPGNLPLAWWVRTAAALWQEDLATAGEYASRGTAAALAAGDRWYLTYAHNQQGHIATARGDYGEARRHYEVGYAIREEFDDPEGMAGGLGHLAKVAARQGAWAEAEDLYRRSLALAREIGDYGAQVHALNGLGLVACAAGDFAPAGLHFAEGLSLAAEVRFMRFILTLLTSAGDWLLQTGRAAEAAAPLALARDHWASDPETRERARHLFATVERSLPPPVCAAAIERGRGGDPAELAVRLAPTLTMPPVAAPTQPAEAMRPVPAGASALVEPLTARESSVLRLIAAGRSNREIADELFLALNTVRSYSQQLYGKLGVGSRTQAIVRARDLRLID